MFRTDSLDGVVLLVCEALEAVGVVNGFTCRTHGFGRRDHGPADRERLQKGLALNGMVHMRQVHGRTVRVHEGGEPKECDGLITDEPGRGLVVQTADCVPLLMWSEATSGVAAVHAGWRGTLAGIGAHAAERLLASEGAAASRLHVAIGPAIRRCCFEVGDELVHAFAESGRDMERLTAPGRGARRHLDLIQDNRNQLRALGVPDSQIYDSGACTVCDNERFYSYRKEGAGVGRIMGVIARR